MRIGRQNEMLAGGRILQTGATLALLCGLTLGCHVDEHKDGNNDNVKFATPFGGLSVKTNDSVVQEGVGLAAYPGAQLVKKEKDKDNGAADVNMSFGSFHLGVKALSYRTPDSPAKVEAFYRKDMAKYGAVIFCRDHRPVGTPVRTQDGLTCESDGHSKVQVSVDEDSDAKPGQKGELKAGSKQHQHIVAIEPEGTGTKFGLVMLDLPGHLTVEDSDTKQ